MEIMIWILPSLLLLLPSSLSFNLSHYTLNLPSDLRPSALSALSAENTSYASYHLKTPSRCRRDADKEPACPPAKFRRPDGVCNNVIHAQWGARGEAMRRMVEPQYADGKSHPRVSTSGHHLPSPDYVTSALQQRPATQHKYVTTLLGAWGELLLQDLVTTVNPRSEKCCSKQHQTHPECYSRVAKECKEYMRSVPAVNEEQECQFKYRDQMNLASSYLDGSAIYGSTEEAVDSLRTFDAGLVNITSCAACATNALYAALLREHNRVAVNLAKLNRHWHDNTLFLEAKRIVAAEIQHITYNEFLTTVLGEESVMQSDLKLLARGHFSDYSSTHHAGVYNEVALTALPAFLSMVPASFMNKTTSTDTFALMVSQLIRTPAYMPSMHIDVKLRSDWDTSSLLVHMGRDHGIAAYPYWLRYCSGQVIDKDIGFDDLKKFGHTQEGVELLKMLYLSPMDIDLLPGAILESPLPGSLVGPTFSCLLKHQFTLLRRSDRFWYENDLPPSSLTPEQLQEIRKVTLAGLLCANTDGLNKIQPMAFVAEDPYLNARITCDQHPLPLLTPWIEMNHMTDLSDDILMDAMSKAEQEVIQRRKMEYESWATFGGADPKSPTGTAASFSKANKGALKLANTSLLFEFASNEILNQLTNKRRKRQIFDNVLSSVFRDELTDGLQNVDVSSLIPAHALDFEPTCDENGPCDPSSPFRTFSGHCNNLRNPNLGKSLTTFARLLPAAYEDGISKPRTRSVTGVPLPNPRTVSTVVHPDISNLHTRYTLMVMQFAQFLDHDLTMTPVHKGFHESIPDCRSCSSPRTVHPECNPFPIPAGDHYYPEVNVTSGQRMCFPFMRSLPGQQHLGPREQLNQNTAFLDASQVYGENRCVCRDLKGFAGRMNSTHHPLKGKELLPQSPSHPECKAPSGYCFIAGDGRASEQPALTVIHTLFLREHNRLVEGLRGVNPHWDSEKLFEHARRIIIAQNQHITYNEFLPRLLSWNAVNLYGLKLLNQGYYKDYNPSCNPSIVTEFAAAAFRIGHSLLRPHIPRLSPTYQVIDPPILLRDGFFKPDMLMQVQMIDEISRGLVSTPMEALDQFITGEVTNHLFEDRRIPFSGIDLVAMNIQRARDHGIPSYNNYRALCNLKRATTFEDLAREIPPEVITRLKRIYPTVDDIDLFPGGMSERPLQGGLVGPTFACIIAIQFRQLRKCDRHWYENSDPSIRFTASQLSELRKTTLAKVICANLDITSDMQRAVLDLPSNFLNPRVSCESLPQIDLSAWRESTSAGCVIADRSVGVGDSAFPTPCTSCVCTTEGAQCASLRVTDCTQLMREWSREAILRDDVCTAQCGFLLREDLARTSSLHQDLVPPPSLSRHVRARQINQVHFSQAFSGFKLPDLTPFLRV